jgi:hypothetical protein
MDFSKDKVHCSIPAASVLPTINNALVVAEDSKV